MKRIFIMLWIIIALVSIFVFQGCFAPYHNYENSGSYYINNGSDSYDGFAPYR